MAGIVFVVSTLAILIPVCRGHMPMYELIKHEVQTFSDKMDRAFSEFASLIGDLEDKMVSIDSNINSTVTHVNQTLKGLQKKVSTSLADSRTSIYYVGNLTKIQIGEMGKNLETMQNDARDLSARLDRTQDAASDMMTAVGEVKDDYEDFKTKTKSVWTIQSNVSDLSNVLLDTRMDLLTSLNSTQKQILTTSKKSINVLNKSMRTLRLVLAKVNEDIQQKDKQVCREPWTKFEHGCYLYVPITQSWKIAKFLCKQLDSHLVELYSRSEIDFIGGFAQNKTVWSAASIGKKGTWYWSGSKSEVDFSLFKNNYLHGRMRQYCAVFDVGNLSLDNVNCGRKHQFVCKKFNIPGRG